MPLLYVLFVTFFVFTARPCKQTSVFKLQSYAFLPYFLTFIELNVISRMQIIIYKQKKQHFSVLLPYISCSQKISLSIFSFSVSLLAKLLVFSFQTSRISILLPFIVGGIVLNANRCFPSPTSLLQQVLRIGQSSSFSSLPKSTSFLPILKPSLQITKPKN